MVYPWYHNDTFSLDTKIFLGYNPQPKIMAPPNKPHYDLARLKKLIGDEDTRYITDSSLEGAHAINFSETEIIETIQSLKPSDFYKAMPSEKYPGLWQDVYHPARKGIKLYVKLQEKVKGKCVVISFKNKA